MGIDSRRIVLSTLTVMGVTAAFFGLYALRGAWFLVFAAIVLGTAARRTLQRRTRAGMSQRAAALTLYGGTLVLLAGAVALLAPLFVTQLGLLADRLPDDLASLHQWLLRSHSPILIRLADGLAPLLSSRPTGGEVDGYLSSAFGVLYAIGGAWFSVLLVVVVSFYWTLEGELALRALLRLVPEAHRDRARELVAAAEDRVGGYLRGQLTVCLISSAVLCASLAAMRLPFAFVLGALAGILEIVPLFGPLAASGLTVLVALSSVPGRAVWVAGVLLANHLIQNYLIAPRIVGRSVGVHPFVVLLSIAVFGSLLGVAGAVLAIPIAAIVQLVLDRLLLAPATASDALDHVGHVGHVGPVGRVGHVGPVGLVAPGGRVGRGEAIGPRRRDRLALLRLRAAELVLDLRKQVRACDDDDHAASDAAEDLTESIVLDVERLLCERERAAETP